MSLSRAGNGGPLEFPVIVSDAGTSIELFATAVDDDRRAIFNATRNARDQQQRFIDASNCKYSLLSSIRWPDQSQR
jgi:uncharacterized protein (UPF0264 family)